MLKTRVGCGDWQDVQRHDKSKFRVQKTVKTNSGWYVQVKHTGKKAIGVFCNCDYLPDSVKKGHYLTVSL
jgi:hypothetical protein